MPIKVRALASGSSGNALLVQADETAILIDAGPPGRQLAARLQEHGVVPGGLAAILVSHEHSDHMAGASALARLYRAPIVSNGLTLAAIDPPRQVERRCVETGSTTHFGRLAVCLFSIPHDAREPVGFALEYEGWRMCSATDVGFDAPEIEPFLAAADLVVLEANHDAETLRAGAYPRRLKERILGNMGHLSNDQSARLLERAFARTPRRRRWLWLAHLSKENNTPQRARAHICRRLEVAGSLREVVIDVAARDAPSASWHSDLLTHQLALF